MTQTEPLPVVRERDAEAVDRAIVTRRSIRGFLPDPIPRQTVEHLLRIASRAPSGSNIQPWRVHVLQGGPLAALKAELMAMHEAGEPEAREYDYYPTKWRSPYLERRRKVGWDLYALAGVRKGDREGSARQLGRNYEFFGAPVGMIFTIDKDLGKGSWLDFGMFLQSIMVAARGHCLDTCPQAALANYPSVVRRQLDIPDAELLLCGMALGFADPSEPTNALIAEREDLENFVVFHG